MKNYWRDRNNPPKESGRYWCYVQEQNDLGLSHFQWNCCYDVIENRWSDNHETMSVTHWMPLAPPPDEFNTIK